jgi:hypothetical protein
MAEWKRSAKGNVWFRSPTGETVTVFRRNGGYRWCIFRRGEPNYSPRPYTSEGEAQEAVLRELDRVAGTRLDRELTARLDRDE